MRSDDLCTQAPSNMGKPEISMAPLVDVVFLLLIFFMVTTVFPDNEGLTIEKPSAENSASMNDDPFTIQLDQFGISYIKNKKVTLDDIKRLVKTEVTTNPQLAVMVQADRRAQTESLINIIDAAKTAGATHLGIATDEK